MSGWTTLSSLTSPTSGAFTFSSLTFTGYKIARVECSGLTVTTDNSTINLTLYVGGVEITATYDWRTLVETSANTFVNDGATAAAAIVASGSDNAGAAVGNVSTRSFEGSFVIDSPASTSLHKIVRLDSSHIATGSTVQVSKGIGVMKNAGAVNGLKVGGSSNLVAGKVYVMVLA